MLFPISDDMFINPDQIVRATLSRETQQTLLTLTDGTAMTVTAETFSRLQQNLRSEELQKVTSTDIRHTLEALDRLSRSIPHSIRVHM